MRKFGLSLLLACVVLSGCGENHDDDTSSCSKECGHGSCYALGDTEKCSCEKGYKQDGDGACNACISGYVLSNGECVLESSCQGSACGGQSSECTKSCGHGTCTLDGTTQKCTCETGYKADATGACTACDTGYVLNNGACVLESTCQGQCGSDPVECTKACGHGTCTLDGTTQKCTCDTGYKVNLDGSCSACADDYALYKGECVLDSVCLGKCEGDYQLCNEVEGQPVCSCIPYSDEVADGCKPWAECMTTFKFVKPEAAGTDVYVTGDFDKWSTNTYKMNETSSGVFELSLYLDPNQYAYKYFIPSWDDKWVGDNGNNFNIEVLDCKDSAVPELVMDSSPIVTDGKVSFSVVVKDRFDKAKDLQIKVTRSDGTAVAAVQTDKSAAVSDDMGADKKVSYIVEATTSNQVKFEKLWVPVWNEDKKFDWRDSILYFAFTDRFKDGNPDNNNYLQVEYGWAGGDFAGLKQKVEEGYFDNLGVNALWISSVSMNTQSIVWADGHSMGGYHSYWPISTGYTDETADLFAGATSNGVPFSPIEPHFGTLEDLKSLVKACHDRGIRVLVDFAANHVNMESPVWQKHRDWFNYHNYEDISGILCNANDGGNWNAIPETCWFGDNLPDFNYQIPEVRKFVVDHAKWLIRATDIDGFRLDAVKHMPIQFIKDLRSGIDGMMAGSGQTFYIVGETFDGADMINKYIGDDMLHGQFDFPLYNVIRGTIMKGWSEQDPNGEGDFNDLKNHIDYNKNTFGNALMSTFLGNHDVARAISYIHFDGGEKYGNNPEVSDSWAYLRLKLAWTFLLTSPGIPLIYYGDEFGLEGANDPDNRRVMKFDNLNDQQKDTLGFVQLLGKIRREHPALSRGQQYTIGAQKRSIMYLMKDEHESILVGLSDTNAEQKYTISEGTRGWINLLNPDEQISDTSEVKMYGGRQIIVWKLKD